MSKTLQIKLNHSEHVNNYPWFSCDLGYTSIGFHPHIEITPDGPTVPYMDIEAEALIINEADRSPLYRLYTEQQFLMSTFWQVVIFDRLDYPYPKTIFMEMLKLDLIASERAVVEQHVKGFTCLYLIRDHDTGLTKIGKSDDPKRRLKELVRQGTLLPKPHNFTLLRAWDEYPYIEKALHNHFAEKRVRGEWFDLSDADIEKLFRLSSIED